MTGKCVNLCFFGGGGGGVGASSCREVDNKALI